MIQHRILFPNVGFESFSKKFVCLRD